VVEAVSAIEAQRLTRRYGPVIAVDHVSFSVRPREIFGFLGPNGAGKSTTVRMLTGYIAPSGGTALLDGHDIVTDGLAARQRLGVVPEEASIYQELTVWQNVMLMAELYGVPRARRTRHGGDLLALFGLDARKADKGRSLSKGLRQRLMLCMALVGEPAILFLDEPTTGLDVASARLIRETASRMNREQGLTVFLTTHNLEEANELCHRVAIINRGRLAAVDTPQALRGTIEGRRSVEVTFAEPLDVMPEIDDPAGEMEPFAGGTGVRIFTRTPGRTAQEIGVWATRHGLRIESIATRAPSLEEVFLAVTGPRVAAPGARR
jgi:ABC-2 type transport system ATP-binding protein